MAEFRRLDPNPQTATLTEKYTSDGIVKDVAILSIENAQFIDNDDLNNKFKEYIKKLAIEKAPTPSDIIEDAARIKEFHFFPDSIISKLKTILNTKQDRKKTLTAAQGVICEGKKPQFTPSYQVHLIIPKPPKGIPLDKAADMRKNYIESARNYLKENFFRSGSNWPQADAKSLNLSNLSRIQTPILGSFFNDYYKDFFYEKFRDTAGEFKSSLINDTTSSLYRHYVQSERVVHIPIVLNSNKKEIESFYKDVRVNTSEGREKKIPSFLSIVFPFEKSMLLVPKEAVSIDLKGRDGKEYKIIGKDGKKREEVSVDIYGLYMPSEYGWQVNEEKPGEDPPFYPLLLTTTSDISFLEDNFTFMFPKEVIYQINSQEKYGLNNWGYDDGYNREESKFSAEKAVSGRWFMWKDILFNQTSITEAVQLDGSIVFELGLDMNLFCQYGVPVTDLLSQ